MPEMNRDHQLLTQKENQALHHLFWLFQPEVTLDIHEYSPYSEAWQKFGFIKRMDEQWGCLTNPNTDSTLIKFSKNEFMPFISNYLANHSFTCSEYVVGSPDTRLRHSTTHFNDGRQSFGLQHTWSLILEGRNGQTGTDRIQRRSEGQLSAVRGFLEFCRHNRSFIKNRIHQDRNQASKSYPLNKTITLLEHVETERCLELPLIELNNSHDTVLCLRPYHSITKSRYQTASPTAYLIEKNDTALVNWLDRHHFLYYDVPETKGMKIVQHTITAIDTVEAEELDVIWPQSASQTVLIQSTNYWYIPTAQKGGVFLMLSLELRSMYSLFQNQFFRYLIQTEVYPILYALPNRDE